MYCQFPHLGGLGSLFIIGLLTKDIHSQKKYTISSTKYPGLVLIRQISKKIQSVTQKHENLQRNVWIM